MKRDLLLGVAASVVLGCASYYAGDVVRDRAARDLRCARGDVSVDDLGDGAYRVKGCGVETLYICNKESAAEGDKPGSLYCVQNQGGAPPRRRR